MRVGIKKEIKSIIISILFLIAILSFIRIPVLAGSEENDIDVLVVGVPADRCPVFYQDTGTGEIVGIGVDLMRLAAEEAGYAATFKPVGEETLKDALDNEAYDVVMPFGSAIPSASGHPTIVSDNLMQTPFTIVTEASHEIPQINELRAGMLHSLAAGAETVSQMYPGIEITLYESMDECVKALRANEVDALLHNSYVWSYVLQKPAYSDLTVQPSTMFSMDFRAGTLDTPEGREIIARLNEGIEGIPDTRRQAIILDYTSRKLYHYDFSDYIHEYGLIIIMGVLLLVLVIVIAVQRIHAVRRKQEEKVKYLIDHDLLTGVLSVNGFRKRVRELLTDHPDTPYFLSYNNIRDFKFINDSFGREAGDALLKFWTKKSMENLSNEEAIGRITADRFAVLRHIAGEEQMQSDEKNVFEPVQNFFINQGKEIKVQICSGIYVLAPKDYQKIDVDHMLDLARVAEKRVRENHAEDFAFYNQEEWERGKRVSDIINSLPTAIQSGDIKVWYQPQVNYGTGKITGAEALCRWEHTKLGWLNPSEFISILEKAGLIYDLDCFVWDRVCQDLQKWNGQEYHGSASVNVSRDDIREDRDIPGHFQNLIRSYGLTPDQLRIEITETAYAERPDLLISTTEKLRSLGFQVEMDDFGSGYSSLNMLKEVPVDRIKLDLRFLTATGVPDKSHIIISCMIRMVRLLGLALIAEGVENVDQAAFLKNEGCIEMQGYYFFKPMPVEEFEQTIIDEETERTKQ